MLDLKLHYLNYKISIPAKIRDSFKEPIIFFIRHKNDPEKIFTTFIIIDFQKQELNYYTTYDKYNINIVEEFEKTWNSLKTNTLYEPHCVITINKNEFLLFYENRSYFYKINLKELTVQIIWGSDLNIPDVKIPYMFWSTFYKDPDNENFFYFTISDLWNLSNWGAEVCLYRSDLRLKEMELVYREPVLSPYACPHTSRKYKNYIFDSVFYFPKYHSVETWEKYRNREIMIRSIFEKIYKSYCTINKINFTEKNFNEVFKFEWISNLKISFYWDFKVFIDKLFAKNNIQSPFEFIQSSKYKIWILPWEFYQYDINSCKKEKYTTKFWHPAHFEIDELNNEIFVSSHNFIRAEKVYYTWVAAVDKFVFSDKGTLINTWTFTDTKWFRFATHRVFHFNKVSYLCVAWEPSRIFFVRTSDMQTEYYIDVEPNNLSDYNEWEDVLRYLNYDISDDVFRVRALEASSDWRYIFVIWEKDIYIIDFKLRKIVHSIRFMNDIIFDTKDNIMDFINNTTHSQILKWLS